MASPDPHGIDPRSVRLGKLSPDEVAEVLEALAELRAQSGPSDRRQHERHACSNVPRAVLVVNPDRERTRTLHPIVPVDLSTSGASILHTALLFENTQVALVLPDRQGRCVPIRSTVRRCRYLARKVHEIGLQFEASVDLSRFLALPPVPDEPVASVDDPAAPEPSRPEAEAEPAVTSAASVQPAPGQDADRSAA